MQHQHQAAKVLLTNRFDEGLETSNIDVAIFDGKQFRNLN
jgi:hypothetical protein